MFGVTFWAGMTFRAAAVTLDRKHSEALVEDYDDARAVAPGHVYLVRRR